MQIGTFQLSLSSSSHYIWWNSFPCRLFSDLSLFRNNLYKYLVCTCSCIACCTYVFILYVVYCMLLYPYCMYVFMLYVVCNCIVCCTYPGMEEWPCRMLELKLINQISEIYVVSYIPIQFYYPCLLVNPY